MVNCSFCKKEIERGTGKLYITKVGKQFWFSPLLTQSAGGKVKW